MVSSTSALILQARGAIFQAFGLSYVALLAPLFSVSLIGLFPVYDSIYSIGTRNQPLVQQNAAIKLDSPITSETYTPYSCEG
ncbi:hypothetical protein [Candidatus Similichlamydia epinepheli]|uniref:hypothetical protein n=1 Tax=Candidatus Similichlamydia epinepheli TaxID=1903953 RepID=UPI001300788E|nr:hypothetical protein [Candidatus Similichlamydia epinepheli]